MPGASAQPLISRMAAACGQRRLPTSNQRLRRRRAPSVRNTAGGFRPAADQPLLQPHGGSLRAKTPAPVKPTPSPPARTFGAKHSRGLPPNRSSAAITAAWRQPAGKDACPRQTNAFAAGEHLRCETQPGASALPLVTCAAWWFSAAGFSCQELTGRNVSIVPELLALCRSSPGSAPDPLTIRNRLRCMK